jgi:hypothetical protein
MMGIRRKGSMDWTYFASKQYQVADFQREASTTPAVVPMSKPTTTAVRAKRGTETRAADIKRLLSQVNQAGQRAATCLQSSGQVTMIIQQQIYRDRPASHLSNDRCAQRDSSLAPEKQTCSRSTLGLLRSEKRSPASP